MSERHIIVPRPAEFCDEDGNPVRDQKGREVPPRSHQWWLFTVLCQHPIFSSRNGFDAVDARAKILEAAHGKESGESYAVSAAHLKMMQSAITDQAKDSVEMTNIESGALISNMRAVMNASTEAPE